MTIAVGVFSIAFNSFGARHLPLFEGVMLVGFVIGFFAICIPLWVLAPKSPASEVFGKFDNFGGWASIGAACIVGQSAASAAFIVSPNNTALSTARTDCDRQGVDSAVHMAEEVKNASLTVPRMMISTVFLNGTLGFVMLITYCFSIQDVEQQILGSAAPYPFVEIFAVATGSTAGAIGMTIPVLIVSLSVTINSTAAASRQAWSFARDDGLPFPRWFTKLTNINSTPLPLNAMVASLAILIVVSLLNFGGSEVFNSIVGLMAGAVGLTYALSIGCVLWRRLYGEPLPPARWSLGRYGVAINIIAVIYETFSVVISFFPLFSQPDAKSMNWGIAMFGGVAIICIVNYFVFARRVYRGPVVNVVKEA